jgi:hypothetical protein
MSRYACALAPWSLVAACGLAVALSGCVPTTGLQHLTGEQPEAEAYDVPCIGGRTVVGNAEPVRVGGVGLVEGLDGTGGDCRHDEYRAMLLDDLKKEKVPEPAKLLASGSVAMVIVEANIPPGAAKGAKIDLEVKIPPGSRATSIRGGVLRRCTLYNFDFARNLRPDYTGPRGVLRGHPAAIAEGPVQMLSGGRGSEGGGAAGKVWQGGRVLRDYPLALVLASKYQNGVVAAVVADRVNDLFLPGMARGRDNSIAHASNNTHIALRVPPQYENNLPRYLRVVRFIPLTDADGRPGKDAKDQRSYRARLSADLLDPSRTIEAALRLEALGPKSISALQAGLDSKNALVRFCSAESLAYLGSPSCAEELGLAARTPLFRAYALTALASLPEAVCTVQLRQLLDSDLDDEVRYGAFRALRTMGGRSSGLAGESLAGELTLHRAAPGRRSLIHLSTTRQAEVVLLGDDTRLSPPFALLAGDFTLRAAQGDASCTVSYIPRGGDRADRQCGLEVSEVIRMMVSLGGSYSDVVALMQQARASEAVSCAVRFDALPTAASLQELAEAGLDGDRQDLGQVPTLYSGGAR